MTRSGETLGPRRGRPHCEGFPSLNLTEIARLLRRGRTICEWTNEVGLITGHAVVLALNESSVRFSFEFFGAMNVGAYASTCQYPIDHFRINPDRVRSAFLCTNCGQRADIIYFMLGSWQCRKCHDLVYLSQRLSPVNRRILARNKLAERLGSVIEGKKKTRDFYNARRHLERVIRKLADDGFTQLPEELRYRMACRWLDPGEMPTRIAEGHPDYDWKIGDLRGFTAFQSEPPVATCLIGSRVFFRPLAMVLSDQNAAREKMSRTIVVGEGAKERPPFRAIKHLEVGTEWDGPFKESVSDDGLAELTGRLRWAGDHFLWMACASDIHSLPTLRVLLDEEYVSVRVRALQRGAWDLSVPLAKASMRLRQAIDDLKAACEQTGFADELEP